jgi:hypothetical protein
MTIYALFLTALWISRESCFLFYDLFFFFFFSFWSSFDRVEPTLRIILTLGGENRVYKELRSDY